MLLPPIVAQIADLPESGGSAVFFWILGAAVILGLWFVISRTRKRSYDAYWERRRREQEQRLNDPDMAKPEEDREPPQASP